MGHLVGTSSLEGMRMSLQLRRIGGVPEEEHASDVDGRVTEIATTPTMVPGGRARALQAVDGAPKEGAESVHAVGHGDAPEAAAGHEALTIRWRWRSARLIDGRSGGRNATPCRCDAVATSRTYLPTSVCRRYGRSSEIIAS